jgi:hypothetical protein
MSNDEFRIMKYSNCLFSRPHSTDFSPLRHSTFIIRYSSFSFLFLSSSPLEKVYIPLGEARRNGRIFSSYTARGDSQRVGIFGSVFPRVFVGFKKAVNDHEHVTVHVKRGRKRVAVDVLVDVGVGVVGFRGMWALWRL